MNRTEKIRKRLDEAYYEGYELAGDIQYLLSKLEAAEKALRKIEKQTDHTPNGITCYSIAKKALVEIRE